MRVTGQTRTNIAGTLGVTNSTGVTSNPNLFLINPNGVLFGPNARLDMRGSFVATTADAVQLGPRGVFSASNPSSSTLLSIRPSALWFTQMVSQPITYRASGSAGQIGLQVPTGASLLLLGGDVTLNGGTLQAVDGLVQVGGLAGSGAIALSTTGNEVRAITVQGERANVRLNNASAIIAAGSLGGTITIDANNLQILHNSNLVAGFALLEKAPNHQAGDILINTTGNITLDRSFITNTVELGASGNAGNISITGQSLTLSNGAQITSSTFGQGNAGHISIRTRGAISLSDQGTGILSSIGGSINDTAYALGRGAIGNGGNIDLQGQSLSVRNGAQVQTIVFRELDGIPGGQGKAGDINVTITDQVVLAGYSPNGYSSGLFTSTERGATGAAGTITMTAGTLEVLDGAAINAITSNPSPGGNVDIVTGNLSLTGGGQILTLSRDRGRAGNITLDVGDRLTLSGRDENFATRLEQAALTGDIPDIVNNQGANSGLFAITASGNGGNIRIRTGNLLLSEGSQISATAGTAQQDGNGGRIGINASNGFVVAAPPQNSDITANAFNGSGGSVRIRAQGILGLIPRSREELSALLGTDNPTDLDPALLPSNDVSAISQNSPNLSGQVVFNTPDVDPTQGLVELPSNIVDGSQLITQNCPTGGAIASELGEFIITGRGGLPPNPTELLGGETVLAQLADFPQSPLESQPDPKLSSEAVVEAQGWVIDEQGEVVLVAHSPHSTSIIPAATVGCN